MKKTLRIAALLAALALCFSLALPVFADEDTSDAAPGASSIGSDPYVVSTTVTDAAGNEVTAINWNDTFNLVLKVVDGNAYGSVTDASQISARINSAAFQYSGLGEVSQLDTSSGSYCSYILLFRNVKYVGGGSSVNIDLSYPDTVLPMKSLPAITIGQCVDKDPTAPEDAKTPSLVVRESSYGTAAVTAGNAFTLSLTLYATDGNEDLSDVIASLTLPDGVTLTGGSLSAYVGSMGPQSTKSVSFSILPSSSFTGGVANIGVSLVGTGAKSGQPASGSSTISVPIGQPDRFELGNLEVPDTIYVGDYTSITLNFVNKGKNPVSNLEASITGENLGVDVSSQYVGNVAAGTESSVDFDLTPTMPGEMSGTITLTYEAADGTIKTLTKDFTSTVLEMQVYDPGIFDDGMMDYPAEPESTGMPVWGWVLIVVGAVVVVVIVVVVVRKRKKAKGYARLEDDDEDL